MKVDFEAVFTDITSRKALPRVATIHLNKMTIIKISLKKIHKREDNSWVIYTDSQSSMQSIEFNKENHLILNLIYGILAELQNQNKQVKLCKATK